MGIDGRLLSVVLTITVFSCVLFFQQASAFDHCNLIDDCNQCLRNFSECAWCADSDWPHPHCFVAGAWYLNNATCKTMTNFESTVTVTRGLELNDTNQVTPTMFSMDLRAKQPVSQIIKVRPAEGYPIDSYYLMDFSYSMKDDLENLKLLAGNLTEEFRRVSEDFTIGFGTFIDKKLAPYSYMDPERLENPCYTGEIDMLTMQETSCPPSYAFRNEMKLANSLETFKETLDKLRVSSNIDFPEGGFEALLQVAACYKKIGFREKSRKIVIYASDAGIHIAGDGKLAGLVDPNDGQCSLDNNDRYYARAEQQDYPTIEQVNQMLIRNNIIPIFAIETDYVELYEQLSNHMTQLSDVGVLSPNSSNIVDLVRDALYRITSTINLVILDDLGYVIDIKPLCPESVPNGCTNVKHGETVEFEATFTLEKCNPDDPAIRVIPIIIPGFDTVFVTVTHQCDCDCYDNVPVSGPDVCSNHGSRVCGPCECRDPYFGDDCECSPRYQKSDELCKSDPNSNMYCSQQGRCECGKCVCRHPATPPGVETPYIRYGEFCECSNYECPKGGNGKICSGLGNCHCGECICDQTEHGVPKIATTEGEACDCELASDKCYNPDPDPELETGHLPCSGPEQGECQCNRCICKPNYRGRYCEECIFCGPLQCSTHIDCVLCLSVKLQKAEDPREIDCSRECSNNGVNYQEVDPTVDVDKLRDIGYQVEACGQYDDDEYDCRANFYIAKMNMSATDFEQSLNITVFYDKEIECDEFALIWIILLIVGAIVLLGLFILLAWKCWTIYADKKLYAKFEEDMAAAKWNTTQSPIYEKPITVHTNPLFVKD
ncbi:hypothetical protein ACHWQZ_G001345 [Mnemiopsis leidyi]